MKNLRKIALIGAVLLTIGATSVSALAAGYSTPAEILAGLTGKSAESLIAERAESGETYGSIAAGYGVLDAFRDQAQEQKEAFLAERVRNGTMTQERADAILAAMEENRASCDGSCDGNCGGGTGTGSGAGFGRTNGGGTGGNGAGSGGVNGNRGGGRNGADCGSGACNKA